MTRALDPIDSKSAPRRAAALASLAIALVVTACGGGTATPTTALPTALTLVSAVPGATALPERSPTPQSSVPGATSTALTPSPSAAPWPIGRLVYGRFDARGVTPFTSNTDGTDERQLLPPHAEGPRWAPDGTKLSVVASNSQGLIFAGTVNPDGSDYVQFESTDPTLNLGCFAWSPDGTRLACEGWDDTDPTRNGIYTVRSTDGGDLIRITEAPEDRHDIPGDYTLDGSQIIFCRSNPEPDETGDDSHLMVVKLDGSDEHQLSDQPMGGGRLSPDGTTILTDSGSTLTLVPVGGGQATPIQIADAPNGIAFEGAWSVDGEWIVFSLHPSNAPHSDIYVMRKDGTDPRQVTHTPIADEEFADWAPAP